MTLSDSDLLILSLSMLSLSVFSLSIVCVLYIHSTRTVALKPQSLYIWTSFHLCDFYCSFHDDDENQMFKTRLDQYVNLLSNQLRTASIIRHCVEGQYPNSQWLSGAIIPFCCVIDDAEYEDNPYMAIMRVISRWTRHEHQKCSSSKASILRNSMQMYLNPNGTGSQSFQLSDAPSFMNQYDDGHEAGTDNGGTAGDRGPSYVRKWSSDSGHSAGPSSFRVHHKGSILPIVEQKEMESDEMSYRHDNISPEDTGTFVHERGLTTKIVVDALDQGLEEETYETKTPETLPETPATFHTFPSALKQDSMRSEVGGISMASMAMAITPAPPTPKYEPATPKDEHPELSGDAGISGAAEETSL